jgi:hypothetical protein
MKRTVRVGIYSRQRLVGASFVAGLEAATGNAVRAASRGPKGAGVVVTVGETVRRARPSTLRDRWRRRHYRLHLPPRAMSRRPVHFAWANCLRRAAFTIADGGVSIFRAYDGVDFRTTVTCSQAIATSGSERAIKGRQLPAVCFPEFGSIGAPTAGDRHKPRRDDVSTDRHFFRRVVKVRLLLHRSPR